ncbi:unnamed protein product [Dicrocoelium dendriticum]|nr:unnamed protein product [Dicrocoelium dendriticum]
MIHKPGSPCVGSARKKDKHNRRSIANNSSSIQPSLVFRITYGQGNGPSLLRRTFLEAGMSEFDPEHHSENQWDLWWKGFRFRECELALLKTSQRVNHHPAPLGRQTDITRKDGLLRAIRHMCVTYPKCSSLLLFPTTFNLPREEHRFVSAFCQRARSARTKTGIGLGCKWTIGQFRQWMADRNINDRFLWIRIQALIILTLLSQASETPKVPNAYELLGFDILVDSHLRPWLLEVNANPSLSNQCMVDEVVKKPLLNSILEMLRLEQSPMGYADERVLYSASLRTHMFPNKSYKDDAKKDPIGHAQREPASHREGAEKSALTQELLSSLGHGCPLYGPGSEWLLPELTSLRIRFSSSLEMNIQMNKLARQRNCSPSSLSSKSTINRLSESKNDFNCHFACENWLIQEKSRAGHKIIPHAFGQLKLAFPFNLIARIACAKERGGYPDQRLIVQQVGRLVQYYARLTKGTAPSTDYSVIDIPEIWEVRQ